MNPLTLRNTPSRHQRWPALLTLAATLALAAWSAAAPVFAADDAQPAPIDEQDLIFLSLSFRNQAKAYLAKPDADERVRAVYDESAGWRGAPGDTIERFRKLAEAYNIMTRGSWDEGRQIATTLDLRLPAKLYEPGGQVKARVFSIWDRPERFSTHYMATLQLMGPDGKKVGTPSSAHFSKAPAMAQVKEIPLTLPADAAAGRWVVRYTLGAHHHDGAHSDPVLEADRSFFVVPGLDDRLAKIEAAVAAAKDPTTESAKVALSTVRWYADIYRRGQKSDVPGAYSDHPLFMVAQLTATGFAQERMQFDRELALAETLAKRLGEGDPLAGLDGDMRLAYTSPVDGERVPFRVYVPAGIDLTKPLPLVVALHGAGGDENAFMERYAELYKKEAQARGYLAVAVNGRGPYTGYRGAAEKDVLDVTDLVPKLWKVDPARVYLMGHSMGGMGTVLIGFDHAERFAALAPIAGFGAPAQLAKAPKMPIFLGQGDQDALVPVEGARAFHQAAKTEGRDVVYVEKAGTDHIVIVDQVMKDVFDFFDAHRRN
jgi:poly(3-hydroxybutyrate) depolymerase